MLRLPVSTGASHLTLTVLRLITDKLGGEAILNKQYKYD